MTGLDRANPADILDAGYSAKPVEAIIEALEDVHDMDVTMRDYAVSVFHRVVKPLMDERDEARAQTFAAVIDLIEGYAATVDSHGALDVDPYRAAKQAAKEILTAVKALAKGGDAT
jgi:hypothetical protein